MTQFTVIFAENGFPRFVAGRYEDLERAASMVAIMTSQVHNEHGKEEFVFGGVEDDIVTVDDQWTPVAVWNRLETKSPEDFKGVDFKGFCASKERLAARSVIGYQIVDENGLNIHGDIDDPFMLSRFDVLKDGAVLTAKSWASDKDYDVVEVFSGDIENPSFVSEISLKIGASPAP